MTIDANVSDLGKSLWTLRGWGVHGQGHRSERREGLGGGLVGHSKVQWGDVQSLKSPLPEHGATPGFRRVFPWYLTETK